MNKGKLQEIGEKLEVSDQDIDSIRKESLKEKWIYPITGALIALGGALAGFILGKNADPVQESGGDGYPYSMKITRTTTALFCGLPLVSLLTVSAALMFRNKPNIDKKKIRITIIIISILFAIVGFLVAYDLARPVEAGGGSNENYGEASDYGVYSREEKP
ncbi:MAG: hypothetical protein KAU14_07010 [Thermoplasmata archaeon]|nr:hypothetical protein [Thermoplasmata archaeon]